MGADLFEAIEPKPSDRTITADLMGRLRRHYIKPGAPLPGGVFLPEVGWNGGAHTTRCDALYIGFTTTSGRLLIGHEVKASRADWLNELRKPGKADPWADQCHEWWLVAAPGVVDDGELPDGWGLMVPGRSKTRMRVVTPARRHPGRTPSWDATRSIIARQDTLRADAIHAGIADAENRADERAAAQVERRVESALRQRGDVEGMRTELDRILRALGVQRVLPSDERAWRGDECTEADLADVAALVRQHGTLAEASRALVGRYGGYEFRVLRDALDQVERARDDVVTKIGATEAAGVRS